MHTLHQLLREQNFVVHSLLSSSFSSYLLGWPQRITCLRLCQTFQLHVVLQSQQSRPLPWVRLVWCALWPVQVNKAETRWLLSCEQDASKLLLFSTYWMLCRSKLTLIKRWLVWHDTANGMYHANWVIAICETFYVISIPHNSEQMSQSRCSPVSFYKEKYLK